MRTICLTCSEAVEAEAFGAPTFQVRTKNLAMLHQPEGRTSVWCKAPPGAQAAYVASEPDRYFAPPYLEPKGWIAAWLDPESNPDWNEIAAIIDESYRLVAPKRLVSRLTLRASSPCRDDWDRVSWIGECQVTLARIAELDGVGNRLVNHARRVRASGRGRANCRGRERKEAVVEGQIGDRNAWFSTPRDISATRQHGTPRALR